MDEAESFALLRDRRVHGVAFIGRGAAMIAEQKARGRHFSGLVFTHTYLISVEAQA